MKSFEDHVFEALLTNRSALCDDDDVQYVRFEKDAGLGGRQYGENSRMLLGRIVYRRKADDKTMVTNSVAIKLSPEVHYDSTFCAMQFANEIHFFTKIVPFLNSTVERGNVDTYFPKFIFGCTRNSPPIDQSAVIFENLHTNGYVKSRRSGTIFVDYAHLSLMMKRIGQFHAYSFRAAKVDLHSFQQVANFIPRIHERFLVKHWPTYQTFVDHYVRILSSNAEPKYSSKVGRVEEVTRDFVKSLSQVNAGSLEVICHGDYMDANVFFKYENDVPVDLKIFDLGLWHLASPALDVAFVMYLCADQQTRDEHWHDLMADYRSGLAEILSVDDMPSEKELLQEFRKHCWFEVMVATYLISDRFAFDAKTARSLSIFAEKYPNKSMSDVSAEDIREILMEYEIGGVEATRAILNVIKDMIDRGFL